MQPLAVTRRVAVHLDLVIDSEGDTPVYDKIHDALRNFVDNSEFEIGALGDGTTLSYGDVTIHYAYTADYSDKNGHEVNLDGVFGPKTESLVSA